MTLTENDCIRMKSSLDCFGNTMKREQGTDVFSYKREVEEKWSWMTTTTNTLASCLLETLNLKQDNAEADIVSPVGYLHGNKALGYAMKHDVTFVWDNKATKDNSTCRHHKVTSGNSSMFDMKNSR